ncbi:fructosamine kinase [Mycolicibacterium madagascariense]|uniref:Fructosamine kinase n=1 Tax=Mycolicibacterium madagascariense TaxID=212765 RepID=A0A7I7XPG3_9MYCO|nr:fructosamine kinase family protein [Mycolicibacterium madagascariense]MCV7015477.1 fructosamine kinase family protein [Mycolicibacterium madagascariense]BBZ31014.1 fructosamine kinase [Mycolicibacterium madagascariense]
METFVKRRSSAPEGFFACEAAGLRWLAAADGGVACVRVLGYDATTLTLQRLVTVPPDRRCANDFGRRLARTHDAGARAFGAAPDGWTGPGFFGPLNHPLPMALSEHVRWGEFYAEDRLEPMAELAGRALDAETRRGLDEVIARCRAGAYDGGDTPARLHGDLWSGNVMWTPEGVVLIDPAAHGGNRETDLAMLALFGCPHYEAVLAGYQEIHPVRPGWRERIGLHQLHPLLAHVVLFGASYRGAASSAVAAALEIVV